MNSWCLRALFLILCFFSGANYQLLAQDSLSEYKDVKTREYIDVELGFKLEHPYLWQPGSNPTTTSDFYIGEPFALPSFWLNLYASSGDLDLEEFLKKELSKTIPDYTVAQSESIELSGKSGLRLTVKWITADAGRHFVRTDILAIPSDNGLYILTINQADRETRWSPRLEAMLNSFMILESA